MTSFKKAILILLQNRLFIVTSDSTNKSKFFLTKKDITISMSFSTEGTALLQYYTKTKVNLKDFFDNSCSDSEIVESINEMFSKIEEIQAIEKKIAKYEDKITALKLEILKRV